MTILYKLSIILEFKAYRYFFLFVVSVVISPPVRSCLLIRLYRRYPVTPRRAKFLSGTYLLVGHYSGKKFHVYLLLGELFIHTILHTVAASKLISRHQTWLAIRFALIKGPAAAIQCNCGTKLCNEHQHQKISSCSLRHFIRDVYLWTDFLMMKLFRLWPNIGLDITLTDA